MTVLCNSRWIIETRKEGGCTVNSSLQNKGCVRGRRVKEDVEDVTKQLGMWPSCSKCPQNLPGCAAQMVWQHLLVQFQKQKCKGWLRWRSEMSVQERAAGDAALNINDFCNPISRNKLHICLGSGFWETDSELQFYWRVLSGTTPVREWRAWDPAGGGVELSWSCRKDLGWFPGSSLELGAPAEESCCEARVWAFVSPRGPVTVLGLLLEREGDQLGWGCSFLKKVIPGKGLSWVITANFPSSGVNECFSPEGVWVAHHITLCSILSDHANSQWRLAPLNILYSANGFPLFSSVTHLSVSVSTLVLFSLHLPFKYRYTY